MEITIKNIRKKAYAKINLFLETLEKRPDGFTEIRTIFAETDLFDELNFVLTKKYDIRILSDNLQIPCEENLIYKIAIFIQEQYRVKTGAIIYLDKKIPISAGLGGGSADAAQTIIGLNELWNLNLSKDEMHSIAAKFGSDINFFLEGGFAIGTGRGEKISPIKAFDIEQILLVNPRVAIAAREAYQSVKKHTENTDWKALIESKDVMFAFNRLQEGIVEKYPIVKACLSALDSYGAKKSIMSGSGSTVIGFFDPKTNLENIRKSFEAKGYWTAIVKINRSSI